jgi:hypothetical protein
MVRHARNQFITHESIIHKRSFVMKKKKSRIQLAREIIAHLRQGMNRPLPTQPTRSSLSEATPFMPSPMPIGRSMPFARSKRSNQLQTSHF